MIHLAHHLSLFPGQGSSPNLDSLFPLLAVLGVPGMFWSLPGGLGYGHPRQAFHMGTAEQTQFSMLTQRALCTLSHIPAPVLIFS